ncbi:uncharacterized protein IUM83_06027 [Phytophthora cinnamomi]|uniref:uncharacterized protein n=1 Tax=Phytophthora cinnamomi TaxID=4785 RepID=UPI00355A593D|nr:hypothetical protein IUM83_06027 [Phytophthora cinnamomi]
MVTSACWLLGGRNTVVEQFPPVRWACRWTATTWASPCSRLRIRVGQRGAMEASGRVSVGSLLLAVNGDDFATHDLGFQEVGQVLRDTLVRDVG